LVAESFLGFLSRFVFFALGMASSLFLRSGSA